MLTQARDRRRPRRPTWADAGLALALAVGPMGLSLLVPTGEGFRDLDAFGAACGPGCVGDESYVESEFVAPGPDTGGQWMLDHVRELEGVDPALAAEVRRLAESGTEG